MTVEVPEELAEAIRHVAQELEAGLATLRSGNPLDFQTAQALAYLMGCGTSREAPGSARLLPRLPYSRSSFEDVSHAVGALYDAERAHVEAALVEAGEVPAQAHSVSLRLDRVSLPMEEPKPRPIGRPRRDAPRRPVEVVFRRAYKPGRQDCPSAAATWRPPASLSIGIRMKRPGSRWKHPSSQHLIDLRSLVLSDCWGTAMDLTLAPLRSQARRAA